MALTREQAWDLLNEYNKGEFHLKHGQIVGDVMRWYANELGYGDEADFWETVGLLHDLDFEMYPDEHCIKSQEIMREKGLDERLIRATASHGYGLHFDGLPEPQHEMEKVLFATDELTGLIGAVALMRPSKSVDDLEVKSVKKKYKDKKFAAGCSRSSSAARRCSAGTLTRSSSAPSSPCGRVSTSIDTKKSGGRTALRSPLFCISGFLYILPGSPMRLPGIPYPASPA